ncbi:F-box protein SNE [Alnus glutinosa]|uniref:F-box protein SNE n=1 Tax=Alnus glutinosa TaxID=3517 RepID=UPI002D7748BD|nr:F-box protein SNE [Alnus glutinosa]
MQQKKAEEKEKKPKFCINDHTDILTEILKRLDGPSLGVAACVCRLWSAIARNDSLWEHLCFRHVASPAPSSVRPVVLALGGYKRLYMVCVRPVLSRLGHSDLVRRRFWTRDEVQLSLSLFCVDYYERRLGGASASSLMFLCKPVNV